MRFSLIQPLFSVPIACIDVETTGASAAYGDRVIEVGIVRYDNGQKTAQYSQLVNPGRRIGPGITALTGISQSMCDGQPTFAEQMPAMLEVLKGAAILGHNVGFDLSFLMHECAIAHQDLCEALQSPPVLDTVRIARQRFGRGGNGLQPLARRLGCEPEIAHRALPDAVTTMAIFQLLLAPVGGWNICLCDAMREQGGPICMQPASPRENVLPLELQEALDQRRPVLMEYLDASGRRTERVVEPIQISRHGEELVLIAHCHLRGDRRNFKLDRIVRLSRIDPHVPSSPVAPLPSFPAPGNPGEG